MRKNRKTYNHVQRRRFIRESLSPGARLPFEEVTKHFPVSQGALYADAQHFKRLDLPIAVEDHAFVMADIRPETAARHRTQINVPLKEAIGRVAADLIVGPDWRVARGTGVDFLKDHAATLDGRERTSQPILRSARRIQFLERLWKKHHRVVTIDGGTTTLAVAKCLSKVVTPQASSNLYALNVFSNSPNLAVQMAGSPHAVVLIGGKMMEQTEAVAGTLAEQCLERWQFHTDIAVLGATALDLARGFGCDTPEEAVIKTLFLERAQFRCVVVDSTKIHLGMGSVATFAPWSSEAVDLLITDRAALRLPADVRQEMLDSGIDVLLASPTDTVVLE